MKKIKAWIFHPEKVVPIEVPATLEGDQYTLYIEAWDQHVKKRVGNNFYLSKQDAIDDRVKQLLSEIEELNESN